MTKNYQIKIFNTAGESENYINKEEYIDNMFEMFVSNKDSFPKFKIERILKIEIETGRIVKEFNRLLTLNKEERCQKENIN